MKKLLSIILLITMLISMTTVAFANTANGIMQPAKIKVGINVQFPPFEYYDENGKLYGFDIDLMNYIGERIGFEMEYVDMSFDKLIPAVASGEVTCAISAISIKEERNSVIDYTSPYLSAKVTYSDGEKSDTSIEKYGIVFPNNSAEKGKLAEAAGEPETSLYNLVNNALSKLIEDKTVEKLGEKYNLNKATDTDDFDYEYTVMPVPGDFDKINMDKSELSSGGQASATSIESSDWAKESVEKAKTIYVTERDRNYNYTQPISREEFCELVFNLICAVNRSFHTEDKEVKFTDTDNHKVLALNQAGIIYGKSETKFAPDDRLTREEAATILVRMINREMPMVSTEMWFEFDDINDISEWASDSVQTMCNLGFMIGVGENKFAPQGTYTTEQAIVTLMRIYEATRKTYTYETPLGVIQTQENYNSHINFAIECDAIVHVIQDNTKYSETHHIIEKPVKALTNQMPTMKISFDDFAEIFGGEWKLTDGVFEFAYDTSHKVEMVKSEDFRDGTGGEWPNKTEAINVIDFYPDMNTIRINGEDIEIKAQYGGKVYNDCITMYNGVLYIPVQMVAELLDYDTAYLQVILK